MCSRLHYQVYRCWQAEELCSIVCDYFFMFAFPWLDFKPEGMQIDRLSLRNKLLSQSQFPWRSVLLFPISLQPFQCTSDYIVELIGLSYFWNFPFGNESPNISWWCGSLYIILTLMYAVLILTRAFFVHCKSEHFSFVDIIATLASTISARKCPNAKKSRGPIQGANEVANTSGCLTSLD